jgi:hypothetical protein
LVSNEETKKFEKKFTRIDVHYASFLITSLSKNKTQIKVIYNIDPNLSYIPQFLINYATKSQGFKMINVKL